MKILPYAVVKFPIDNLIGVICTKWITSDGKHCLYPASKSELFNMTLILKKEKEAMPGWDKHAVVILGKYATYADAKKYESKAEDTSNLSEDDEEEMRKRKRKPNSKYEESDDDHSPSPPLKKHAKLHIPKHPPLLSFSHSPFQKTPLKEINYLTSASSPTDKHTNINQEHSSDNENRSISSPSIHNQADTDMNMENLYHSESFEIHPTQSQKSSLSLPSPSHLVPHVQFKTPPQKKKNLQSAFNSSIHSQPDTDKDQECSYGMEVAGIQPLQTKFSTPNQNRQRKSVEHTQVMDKLNHLIEMVSALSQRIDDLSDQMGEHKIIGQEKTDKSEEILSLLPIGDMLKFDHFERRLTEEETFRKSFVKAMSSLGGRDPSTLVINVLKSCIADKTAELFSLTGKKMGNFPAKRKFCETRVCNCIFDAVRRRHKDVTNDSVKRTIKNWLQQATPRIQKREKRQEAAATGGMVEVLLD